MTGARGGRPYRPHWWAQAAIALVIGALVGQLSPTASHISWADVAISGAALTLPALVALLAEAPYRRSSAGRALIGLDILLLAMIVAAITVSALTGQGAPQEVMLAALVLLTPALGGLTGMVAGSGGKTESGKAILVAMAVAMAAWLGLGLRSVGLGLATQMSSPTNNVGGLLLLTAIAVSGLWAIGLGLAALEGIVVEIWRAAAFRAGSR